MFKGNNKYIWIFIGMFVLIVLVQYFLPKPVNWQRTYSYKDKNPFGTYAINNLLEPTFCKESSVNKTTLYNLSNKDSGKTKTLILINDIVNISKPDLKTLYDFISNGNSVFISANRFEGIVADTFHLRTNEDFFNYYLNKDSAIKTPGVNVKFNAINLNKKTYNYSRLCYDFYFRNYDSTKFTSYSVTTDNKAVLIKANIGKGKLFLMSMPDVFTNYFIVKQPNRTYAYGILSLITQNSKVIIWDEYYKAFNKNTDSMFKFIFDSDALYSAYLLMILSLIVYMVFDGRRRQRAIPILEPVKNTTLEFVNVVSHVYFSSENHKYIAEERVKYFYDNIRKRFQVSTNELNENFFLQISELSGYDLKLIKQLFMYCERLKQSISASEYDLIELNRQITNFNNKSLR